MHIRAFQSSASVKRYLHGKINLRDYRLSISVLVLQSCLIMSSIRLQAGYTLFTFPNHLARMKRWVYWSVLLVSVKERRR